MSDKKQVAAVAAVMQYLAAEQSVAVEPTVAMPQSTYNQLYQMYLTLQNFFANLQPHGNQL